MKPVKNKYKINQIKKLPIVFEQLGLILPLGQFYSEHIIWSKI